MSVRLGSCVRVIVNTRTRVCKYSDSSHSQQYRLCTSTSYLEIQAVFCVQFLFFATKTAKMDARKFWRQ